jgi:hypothetical protein
MYFRARYYDPTTGEFVSRDPLEYVDGMSLYRGYFGLSFIDPSGMHIENTGKHNGDGLPIWHNIHTGKCFVRVPKQGVVLGEVVEVTCPTIPKSGGVVLAPSNCCKEAKRVGLDAGKVGLVICCGDTKVPCVFKSGGASKATNPTAVTIIDFAVMEHEKCHLKHTKPCLRRGCHVQPAKFDDDTTKDQGECECYKAQFLVLRNAWIGGLCGTDQACNDQIGKEIDAVTRRLDIHCGHGWEKDVLDQERR